MYVINTGISGSKNRLITFPLPGKLRIIPADESGSSIAAQTPNKHPVIQIAETANTVLKKAETENSRLIESNRKLCPPIITVTKQYHSIQMHIIAITMQVYILLDYYTSKKSVLQAKMYNFSNFCGL